MLQNGPPMEFHAPKGYKSPFVDLEMSLNELWKGEKKFLWQFHKPHKTGSFKEANEENKLEGEFNPETKVEAHD